MEKDPDNIEVENNREMRRFEIRQGGEVALIDYILRKDRIIFLHTEVPEAMQGQGFATKMAKTALGFARENHLKVTSLCSYMDLYLARHPEYEDLLK